METLVRLNSCAWALGVWNAEDCPDRVRLRGLMSRKMGLKRMGMGLSTGGDGGGGGAQTCLNTS